MADYKLYCMGESGNAYKAALTLELSGLKWDQVFVDFFKGAVRTSDFQSLNVMGEVPVLEHGDLRLSQSGVIQDYIVEQTGMFGGNDKSERREIWRWVLFDNHKLSSQIGTTRFLSNFIPKDKQPAGVIPFLHGRLNAAYKTLEAHLEDREWIVGSEPSVADFSCCGYLYYPEEFGFNRHEWPNINQWLNRISDIPGWKHPYDMMERAYKG